MAEAVTLITPFHNTGPVFHETAASVFQQTMTEWKWLIINDGSSDPQALQILSEYRSKDSRIEVVDCAANTGLSAARNLGFRLSKTEVVVQLDSDDLLEPTALEKWLWFLISCPEFSFVKGYSTGFGAHNYAWEKGFHYGKAFLNENLVDPTAAVRKIAWEAAGGYDESIRSGLEDWDFWLRCASTGHWGSIIPEYLNCYRTRVDHSDRWQNLQPGRLATFRRQMQMRFPNLWRGGFPAIHLNPLPGQGDQSRDDSESLLHNDRRECGFSNPAPETSPRLLFIIPWMEMGGADQFNLDLIEQLTRRGWQVTIAATAPADNTWFSRFTQLTPDIFCLPNFLRLADYPRFLRYLISSRKPTAVLLSHSEMGYRLLPYMRSHFPGLPLLDYCHVVEEGWKDGGYPQFSVKYQGCLDATGVTSLSLKKWMAAKGAESGRIDVCHLGVNSEKWKPDANRRHRVRQDKGLDPNIPLILYAARFCPQKQPQVFADTVRLLKQSGASFHVFAAGAGPLEAALRVQLTRMQLLDKVQLLGPLAIEEIQDVMAAAEIFFLPSAWEGIALVIYEAMAAGLPVVAADVGGQRELVTPTCGVLLPHSNPVQEAQDYCQALLGLLQNPDERKRMGQAARERAAQFNLEAMTDRMVNLIQLAQDRRRHAPGPAVSLTDRDGSLLDAIQSARADGVPQLPLLIHRQQLQNNRGWNLYLFLLRWFSPLYRGILWMTGGRIRSLKNLIKKGLTGVP